MARDTFSRASIRTLNQAKRFNFITHPHTMTERKSGSIHGSLRQKFQTTITRSCCVLDESLSTGIPAR